MKTLKKIQRRRDQSGIALLLAIFVLLLVCVVGLAMMAASGTETSLTGNYRSSTSAYYAALSGLEEARGRLMPKDPHYITSLPPFGSTLPIGQVFYITNPLGSEIVDPTSSNTADYGDIEYSPGEFSSLPSSVQTFPPAFDLTGSPNAFYKWVRINALTEDAIQIDVNNTNPLSHPYNQVQPLYFDGTNLTRTVTPYQALGLTALAGLPDGSRKLLQYVVAPITPQIPIQAALALAGPGAVANIVTFNQPPGPAYSFQVNGNDQAPGSSSGLPPCLTQPSLPAIGVLNSNDYSYLHDGALTSPHPDHYAGVGGNSTTPSVSASPYLHPVHLADPTYDMTDPASLLGLVDLIQSSADAVLTGPATGSDMPSAMLVSNPQTVVVKGDLTLSGYTGYGLLIVTGKLTYTGDSGWKGIVLVIGQGVVEETGSTDGGEFDGAIFVAKIITGAGGDVLGPASYTVASPGGKGIYYNSCWVAAAQKPVKYKVLSFHEIPYP